jgi:molybdopterin molybdotransferase
MTTGAAPLLPLEEARAQMLDGLAPLPAEEVALNLALDRVLADTPLSRLTLPPWDNSAMDGFAVRAADVTGATHESPVRLRVTGEAQAGHQLEGSVAEGAAMRILTGAPLPDGADAVVPVEDTDAAAGAGNELPVGVSVFRAVSPGTHVRRAGSDLRAGLPVAQAGSRLTPALLAVAAAAGYASVNVYGRPRVAVLATGDELVPAGTRPGPAQISDSNSVGLANAAREAGAEPHPLGIARDDLDEVVDRLGEGIARSHVVVVSGGVSVGAHDIVKEAFERVGRVALWRVAVQPGKPLAFGRAQGRDGRRVLLFGLPGNPVSSLVTFELFVRPVLRRLGGHSNVIGREIVRARLAQNASKAAGRRAFLRVRLEPTSSGWQAELAGGQDSHVLSALAAADGLAVIPEDVTRVAAGTEVEVIRLR